MMPRGYLVSLYGPDDKLIDEPFELPSPPYPGQRVAYAGGVWEVASVLVMPPHPRSIAAREGAPATAEARVLPSFGIRDP